MKSQLVDTNILVYSTIEDSEYHEESLKVITENEILVPKIVIFEYIWVLAKLTNNADLIERKLEELKEFEIVEEKIDDIIEGIKMLKEDGKTLSMLNDYIILAVAKRLGVKLATKDEKLKKTAIKRGIEIL